MINIYLITFLFAATNLDFFLIIIILLNKYKIKNILIGYVLGILISLLFSYILGKIMSSFIPNWIIGSLGIIPVILSFKKTGNNKTVPIKSNDKSDFLYIALLYLMVCGPDNLSIYPPILSKVTFENLFLIECYFLFLSLISFFIAFLIGKISIIKFFFSKHNENITRILYLLIGSFIMMESGFLSHILYIFR